MDYSKLLPYSDSEVPVIVQEICRWQLFPALVKQINPEVDVAELIGKLQGIHNIDEFQHSIMLPLILHVVKETTESFTISGLEQLDRNQSYLFIANHRDITLDAALLSVQLMRHNYKTPAVSFGDNLIANPVVAMLARLNRMFPVQRSGTRREFYQASVAMSNYIQYMLHQEQRSVWIAQRNGRTKDGDDRTEPGLLKMLTMATQGSFYDKTQHLNIVPLCISYEYEPCDKSKAREMQGRAKGGGYVKRANEDILRVWEGISQQKGQVHLAFCPPITAEELLQCQEAPMEVAGTHSAENDTLIKGDTNAPYVALAQLIDHRIWAAYRISGLNKLAYDIVQGIASEDIMYTAKTLFRNDYLLQIYARPLINQKSLEEGL